jgi:hypothetical protein
MNIDRLRQLKMASGEEIVCEVIEWDTPEEPEIVVRNIYEVITVESTTDRSRYHTMKPYLCLQNNDEMFQTLNPYHIMATAVPSETVIGQYKTALKFDRMTQKEFEEEVEKKYNELKKRYTEEVEEEMEYEDENILHFPFDKDKLH